MAVRPISAKTRKAKAISDVASWYCAIVILCLFLLSSVQENYAILKGYQLLHRPCDEIYVVGEGETLHTISDISMILMMFSLVLSSRSLLSILFSHRLSSSLYGPWILK
ncbi:hypothetical protein A4A49_11394 [Nicotiana attenuata]|uniref:Uncharacterized protein n=1 Tax=Nicotiana attenuata TaxID=49451 RepID=A0A1J6IFV2_NICAT|nr:hypothetical protein A4A49_11394 [Nicotiana attenuata]